MSSAFSSLILASTSPYRRELLQRLHLPFDVQAPHVDETPLPLERPAETAQRLAWAKAQAVSAVAPHAIVIGCDQVADLDGHAVGKPGSHERAREQLRAMSARTVVFHTAVAVMHSAAQYSGQAVAQATVRFRALTDDCIERYLSIERPYDCAGSAKCEALGIVLVEAIQSDDPTALIGLPLIRTAGLLREAGLDPLVP